MVIHWFPWAEMELGVNWGIYGFNMFSIDPSIVGIQDEEKQIKRRISVYNILGKQTKETKNTPLFYIYDDGTVEKKIIIE